MLYSIKRIYKKKTEENQVEEPGFFSVYFVARKKIFKRSVDRNKVKRRARHAFKQATIELGGEFTTTNNSTKQIIFFLEHDMIQESYQTTVDSFKKDLTKS